VRLIRTPAWFQSPRTRFSSISSAVRQVFASTAEAEEYAQSMGVAGTFYENRFDIGNLASEFIAQLNERKLPMPLSIQVNTAYFGNRFPESATGVPALGEAKVILINPNADFWQDPILITQALYQVRAWSTPSALHIFWHEYAHLFQEERTRWCELTPRKKTMAAAISQRAMKNVDEFVAEVYAGIVEGVEYDQDILAYYRRLGGKLP
jgi:hypothetical protein